MKKTHPELGRAFVFAGLTAALALGIIGSCCYRRHTGAVTTTPPRQILIEMLDAQARPHFDEARRNIPSVVDEMTGTGALCKLCWLMSRDKVTGSHKTQDYLESMLNGPIVGPCRAGAKVYGCDITAAGFVNGVRAVNSDYALTGASALTGLSIEALFLKKTIASLSNVLGKIVARLAVSYRGGTACAAADGPLPIGDIIGIVMAAGGTVWSAYDLYQVKTQLGPEMRKLLQQSVRECQAASSQMDAQAAVQPKQPTPESTEQETPTTNTNTTPNKEKITMINTNTIHTVSAPVQTVAPNHEPELNPLDELMANIEAMKAKLKAMFDDSAALSRKVREVALAQRQKEREYVQTKRTIERIRTASGF